MKICAYKNCKNTVKSRRNQQFCSLHSKVKNPTGTITCGHPGCKTIVEITSFRRYCDLHKQKEFVKARALLKRKNVKYARNKTERCKFCENMRGVKKYHGYCSRACENAGLRFLAHKTKTPPTVYVAQSNYGIVHPWPTFRGV